MLELAVPPVELPASSVIIALNVTVSPSINPPFKASKVAAPIVMVTVLPKSLWVIVTSLPKFPKPPPSTSASSWMPPFSKDASSLGIGTLISILVLDTFQKPGSTTPPAALTLPVLTMAGLFASIGSAFWLIAVVKALEFTPLRDKIKFTGTLSLAARSV